VVRGEGRRGRHGVGPHCSLWVQMIAMLREDLALERKRFLLDSGRAGQAGERVKDLRSLQAWIEHFSQGVGFKSTYTEIQGGTQPTHPPP
jgi:hypothetical protein